jgi:Starch-binding associating with outer membrane
MKLFNNIKNKALAIGLLSAVVVSCTDYLDVDKDTDNPVVAPLSSLLTGTQIDISDIGDYNNNGGATYSVLVHQMCDRGDDDQYGTRSDDIGIGNDWNSVYFALRNINSLISQATESGDFVYAGIGQIEKAYIMSVAVDLWGDVPYTEAARLATDNIASPKFDDQKLIYKDIFRLLEEGKLNVVKTSGKKPTDKDDLIYKGSGAQWKKFANTLKLKLYNQIKTTSEFDQVGFDALIAENNFMASKADDFQVIKTAKTATNISQNERNRMYVVSYESTQFGSYISPWFYEILKGVNPNIHTGTPDPRMKYMICNQIAPNSFPPDQGDVASGNPKADYWDKTTGFYSIRFGSSGPYRDASAEGSYSYPGIYPCGGKYDTGSGGAVNQLSGGKGLAPRRILTFDEFEFIRAELILAGKLPGGDAGALTKLEAAIKANFSKIDEVVTKTGVVTTPAIPILATNTTLTTPFLTKIKAEYNAATTPSRRLEIIMTQKWIATFGDSLDQYSDYRRTGFPLLYNPLSTSQEYQSNFLFGITMAQYDAQTTYGGAGTYLNSMFWPQDELNGNENSPAQKVATSYKIFWDNN